jgi:hypothetical protein
MSDLGSAMTPATPSAPGRFAKLGRLRDALVVRAHAMAVRFDATPDEFGKEGEVDETDPHALVAEWRRCLEAWAGYNPEEVFAVKVGVALLAAALFALWVLVALVR